jgi:nitrite reductase/ring-hydroxylating ferredoxin subunit
MLQTGNRAIVRTSLSQPLCHVADIPEEGAFAAEAMVEGEACDLLLTRQGTQVRCFHNVCPHAGRRLDWAPGRFLVDKGHLVCAVHGASFRPDDGECISGPCRGQSLAAVAVDIREGQVFLDEAADRDG